MRRSEIEQREKEKEGNLPNKNVETDPKQLNHTHNLFSIEERIISTRKKEKKKKKKKKSQ